MKRREIEEVLVLEQHQLCSFLHSSVLLLLGDKLQINTKIMFTLLTALTA